MNKKLLLFFTLISFHSILYAQWKAVGPENRTIFCLAAVGPNVFAGTDSGVYRSTDNGDHWDISNEGLTHYTDIHALSAIGQTIYAAVGEDVFSSLNSGLTWNLTKLKKRILSFAVHESTLYAGSEDGEVLVTIDGGKSWVITNTANIGIRCMGISSSSIFIGSDKGIFRSTNFGDWISENIGYGDVRISSLLATDTSLFAATYSGIFLSYDNGNSWDISNTGLDDNNVNALATSSTGLYAGTDGGGVYLSTNNGEEWASVGLATHSITSLVISAKSLFAISSTGILWRLPLSEIPHSEIQQPGLSQFHLHQNYPNPFFSSTTIPFELPERTYVSLKVYDITGREVAVLANETIDAGSYTRTFNADALPNGMYVCRIDAGAYRETRTLLVVR